MCRIKLVCSLFVFLSLKQWLLVFLQVSKDLPEKQKEIEILLKDFVDLDQQLNQEILWVTPVKNQLELYNKVGQPGAFDIKVNFPPFKKSIGVLSGQKFTYSISCIVFINDVTLRQKPAIVPRSSKLYELRKLFILFC